MNVKIIAYVLMMFFPHFSIGNNVNISLPDTILNKPVLFNSVIGQSKDSLMVYFKNDSVFFKCIKDREILLSTSWSKKGNYPFENLKGIYLINKNSIRKFSAMKNKNLIYFTIFDESYRGQLYVINYSKKILLNDKQFKRKYLVSPSGIFLIDKQRNRIITIDKPFFNEKINKIMTPFVVYSIKNESFHYVGIVRLKGEFEYSDSRIVQFYEKYRKANGDWTLIR